MLGNATPPNSRSVKSPRAFHPSGEWKASAASGVPHTASTLAPDFTGVRGRPFSGKCSVRGPLNKRAKLDSLVHYFPS
jgi:hypothetical protein